MNSLILTVIIVLSLALFIFVILHAIARKQVEGLGNCLERTERKLVGKVYDLEEKLVIKNADNTTLLGHNENLILQNRALTIKIKELIHFREKEQKDLETSHELHRNLSNDYDELQIKYSETKQHNLEILRILELPVEFRIQVPLKEAG